LPDPEWQPVLRRQTALLRRGAGRYWPARLLCDWLMRHRIGAAPLYAELHSELFLRANLLSRERTDLRAGNVRLRVHRDFLWRALRHALDRAHGSAT
jgi:hypothetical protein